MVRWRRRRPPRSARRRRAAGGELGQRLAQHRPVRLQGQDVEQAGKRRLRGEVGTLRQRRGAARAGDGEPQGGIEPQRVGVVLVAPALGEQHQQGAQQVGQGIADEMGLPWIVQPCRQPRDDAGPLDRLAYEDGAGVAGQTLGSGLHKQAGVEAAGEERWRFTHGVARLVVASRFSSLDLLRDSRHASRP
jgi:hypothetical protein